MGTIRLGQRCIDADFAHQGSPPLWAMPSSLSMGTPKDWIGKTLQSWSAPSWLKLASSTPPRCSPRHRAGGILGLHHRCSLLVLTRGQWRGQRAERGDVMNVYFINLYLYLYYWKRNPTWAQDCCPCFHFPRCCCFRVSSSNPTFCSSLWSPGGGQGDFNISLVFEWL